MIYQGGYCTWASVQISRGNTLRLDYKTTWTKTANRPLVFDILENLYSLSIWLSHIDGLVQERCDSSVLSMELRLSCINPSTRFGQERFLIEAFQVFSSYHKNTKRDSPAKVIIPWSWYCYTFIDWWSWYCECGGMKHGIQLDGVSPPRHLPSKVIKYGYIGSHNENDYGNGNGIFNDNNDNDDDNRNDNTTTTISTTTTKNNNNDGNENDNILCILLLMMVIAATTTIWII